MGLALIIKTSNLTTKLNEHIWDNNVLRLRNTTNEQLTSCQLHLHQPPGALRLYPTAFHRLNSQFLQYVLCVLTLKQKIEKSNFYDFL